MRIELISTAWKAAMRTNTPMRQTVSLSYIYIILLFLENIKIYQDPNFKTNALPLSQLPMVGSIGLEPITLSAFLELL